MTNIRVYHSVQSVEALLAKLLLQKMLPEGMKVVVVTGTEADAKSLNVNLWTRHDISFIPHCLVSSDEARDTPVLITHVDAVGQAPVCDVMVALDGVLPMECASYENLISIVKGNVDDNDNFNSSLEEMKQRGFKCKAFDMSERTKQ